MKWSRINSQRRFLIPNTVKMIIETIIQLPSSALSKSQWMALIRVRSSHSPATEQLWPPPHTNQHKCCQSKTVLFQKVKLCFFWGHSKVQSWGDVLLLLHQMVLPKIQGDNLCPNLLAPSVLYLNLIMQRPDKREMSFLYQMLTKPSNWFAVQTRHQQCWSSIKTIKSTDWLVAPLCIIKLNCQYHCNWGCQNVMVCLPKYIQIPVLTAVRGKQEDRMRREIQTQIWIAKNQRMLSRVVMSHRKRGREDGD